MTLINALTAVIGIMTILISIVILLENRSPSRTVAWLMVLILLPGVGIFIYLYIGQNHKKKKTFIKKSKKDYKIMDNLLKEQASFTAYSNLFHEAFDDIRGKLIPLLMKNTHSPITVNNSATILQNGEETFSTIIEAIYAAKESIHIEYFIIKDSVIGRQIQGALIEQARAGLTVRLIYDAVGCWRLRESFLGPLREAGVQLYPFLPVSIPLFGHHLNYRNHRKIIIIDGKVGFLGGLNIGDEYLGKNRRLGFWRDTHLKIQGEAVYVLQAIFLMDWYFVSGEELDDPIYFPKQGHCGEQLIQIASSGPDSQWESIHQAYFTAINSATNRVYMMTPYLIPDEGILMALKTAAIRGVEVRLLLPSIPDHNTVFWASKSHFTELLEAGVKIYQYQKGFVHGKVMVADDYFASIGTANLDIRSFHLNFEVNAFIYDKEVNQRLVKDFQRDFNDSIEVTLEAYKKRPTLDRFKESLARLFSPIL